VGRPEGRVRERSACKAGSCVARPTVGEGVLEPREVRSSLETIDRSRTDRQEGRSPKVVGFAGGPNPLGCPSVGKWGGAAARRRKPFALGPKWGTSSQEGKPVGRRALGCDQHVLSRSRGPLKRIRPKARKARRAGVWPKQASDDLGVGRPPRNSTEAIHPAKAWVRTVSSRVRGAELGGQSQPGRPSGQTLPRKKFAGSPLVPEGQKRSKLRRATRG